MTEKTPNIETGRRSVLALTLAICFIYGLTGGLRGNFGVLLQPLADNCGLSYGTVSSIFAVSQLVFGLLQPAFGILALRTSNRTVMCIGTALASAGLLLTPFVHSAPGLLLSMGLLFPAGTAGLSFGLLLGIVSPQVSESQGSIVSGWLNASSGIGTTVLAPAVQAVFAAFGLLGAMLFLGVPTLLFFPLTFWLCRTPSRSRESGAEARRAKAPRINIREMVASAWRSRDYRFLLLGFSTCGFHIGIVEMHFFNQLTFIGLERSTAALLFTLYGVFTMTGSALSGYLCTRLPMHIVLGTIYGVRVLLGLLMIAVPNSAGMLAALIVFIGLTSDSTVSPTSGLILRHFGAAELATLFGFAFLLHQVGCFASAWFGGWTFDTFHTYSFLWLADAALCAAAAFVSFRVRERPEKR